MKELLSALANVKKEVGTLSKTATNPFFKSKYFDINSLIEQVDPLLEKNGLLLLQPIEDGKVVSVIYHVDTEMSVKSEMVLPNLQDPQKLGSAITYYRRYTLQSLLGLQAEDDDGNKASAPVKVDISRLEAKLKACTTTDDVNALYKSFTPNEQAEMKAIAIKVGKELKESLTLKTA
jgi:hypothetical protein